MSPGILRLFAVTTLVAGSLALESPSAHADVLTDMTADVELSWTTLPTGAACTISTTGPTQTNTPVPADGRPHTASITATVTATQASGDTMTATVTETRTITATASAGQLAHVRVKDSWSASFHAQGAGANCNLELFTHGDTVGYFTMLHPAWVTVTATGHGVQESASVGNDAAPTVPGTDTTVIGAIGGGATRSVGTGHGLLPRQAAGGRLGIFPLQQANVWAPTTSNPATSKAGTGTVDIRFDTPGAATGPTSGSGKKYVQLTGAENCASHVATATWTTKAGKGRNYKVAKATFKVGHKTVGKARRPANRKVTLLKGLPATGSVQVVGTLRLRTGKTLTVTRSYVPCG